MNIAIRLAAAALIAGFAALPAAIAHPPAAKPKAPAAATDLRADMTLKVEGMDCESCAKAVETNLEALPEILKARADVGKGCVDVQLRGAARPAKGAIEKAVEAAGFVYAGLVED